MLPLIIIIITSIATIVSIKILGEGNNIEKSMDSILVREVEIFEQELDQDADTKYNK
jgi:hypothetical protein